MGRILIVGGVAGGASVAARLRRLDENVQIVLIERGEHISYANCGLPYFAGNVITDRERLFVMTPQKFQDWLAVEVRTQTEAIAIDLTRKVVHLKDLRTGHVSEEPYDKLVLSPGAEPLKPAIPGLDLPGIFTLRSVPDVDRIKAWIDDKQPKQAVVVGGGFIGLEMAENLRHRGIAVTLVEAQSQVMTALDPDMAAFVHEQLQEKDVKLGLQDGVKAFHTRNRQLAVALDSGKEIVCDMVIFAIGVRPDTGFAKASGIACSRSGAIQVDEHMQSSDPHVFALGDAVEAPSPLLPHPVQMPLAGPANKQARVVAENLVVALKGEAPSHRYPGAIGTAIVKVFDLIVACTGLNEKNLTANRIPFETAIVHGYSHAGYYPGALPLTLKAHFDPHSGRLLGAQAVGHEGVDKRIDLLAGVVQRKGLISELVYLEHAYAPPFSSAKDPINLLGMVGENLRTGLSQGVQWRDVQTWMDKEACFLDVRTREEFALGSLPGAINIPHDEIRTRLSEVPKDCPLMVFCGVGLRGYLAERILRQHGFHQVANLIGGYKTWALATGKQHEAAGDGHDVLKTLATPSATHTEDTAATSYTIKIDACGLQCPGPIMRLKGAVDHANNGDKIILSATDPGFAHDVVSWCRVTGHTLQNLENNSGIITATIEKQSQIATSSQRPETTSHTLKGASFIVFSDSLDRALASFVLANGALASGKPVSMFFTFWGLSILKRKAKPSIKKDIMGRMFGWMLPSHTGRLALSKMNFFGAGRGMMKGRMASKSVDDLDKMIASAQQAGVKLLACQMSMDLMGIDKAELIDGVELGGVATYMEAASQSDVNLFI